MSLEPRDLEDGNCNDCDYWRSRINRKKGVAIPGGYGKCTRPEGHCAPDIVRGGIGYVDKTQQIQEIIQQQVKENEQMGRKPKDAVEQAQENIKSIERSKRTINAHEGFRALTQAQMDEVSRKNRMEIAASQWLNGAEYDLDRIGVQIQESLARRRMEGLRAGYLLNAVKEVEGYSFFGNWVKINFPQSLRTAQNCMRLARRVKEEPSLIALAGLGPSKALVLLQLDDEYIDEFKENGTIAGEPFDEYYTKTRDEIIEINKKLKKDKDKIVDEATKGLTKERDTALLELEKANKQLALYQSEERKAIEDTMKDVFDACLLFVKKSRILMEDERIKNRVVIGELFGKIEIVREVLAQLFDDLGDLARSEEIQQDA